MINLAISIAACAAPGYFLINGFQDMGIMELLFAAVLTGMGKTYIRRYKESNDLGN